MESLPADSEERTQVEKRQAPGLIGKYTGMPMDQLSQLQILEIGDYHSYGPSRNANPAEHIAGSTDHVHPFRC